MTYRAHPTDPTGRMDALSYATWCHYAHRLQQRVWASMPTTRAAARYAVNRAQWHAFQPAHLVGVTHGLPARPTKRIRWEPPTGPDDHRPIFAAAAQARIKATGCETLAALCRAGDVPIDSVGKVCRCQDVPRAARRTRYAALVGLAVADIRWPMWRYEPDEGGRS